MTTQTGGRDNESLKAYAFVMDYGKGHTDAHCIAKTVAEAEAWLASRCADWGPLKFFNTGVAVMKPAIIEWWVDYKRMEKEGYYAFLQGVFFCKCGDYQKVAHCRQEESKTGWIAYIYGNNHQVKPL